jgi:hypothetical protein
VTKPPKQGLYTALLFLDLTFLAFALLAGNTLLAAVWGGLAAHAAWNLKEIKKGRGA